MTAELMQRMSDVEEVLWGVRQGLRSLDERLRLLSEQQATIIGLLTPKEKPKKDGPGLDELLEAMIARLDAQNALLKDVSGVVSQAVTVLPLSVVQAIADAFGPADGSSETTPRNGHRGGAA